MITNKKVRFAAICNLKGEVLFQKRRDDVRTLFSLEETKIQLQRTLDSWKARAEIKDKVGRPLYSVTSYERIKRITIPIDDEHLVFVSIDNNDEEIQRFGNISIKNISKLLENNSVQV